MLTTYAVKKKGVLKEKLTTKRISKKPIHVSTCVKRTSDTLSKTILERAIKKMTIDKRVIWKDKSDLEMMIEIKNFIANHGISSVREYQSFKKKYPNDVPGLWVIQQRFDSWEKMLVRIGNKVFDRYR